LETFRGVTAINTKTRIVGIIPARWASSRFPGKPLHPLLGKPLLQHVCERAALCQELDEIIVATDDSRIAELAENLGVKVAFTREDHPSGTDRIAEAITKAENTEDVSHVINIQGDEPLLNPALVDQIAATLRQDDSIRMITAGSPIHDAEQVTDVNIVKLVLDAHGDALYFSRSPIPYRRDSIPALANYRHLGLYGYRVDFLQHLVSLPPSLLEQAEGLEQLRALEDGVKIRVIITEHDAIGLDSPEQIPLIESLLTSQLT